MNEYPFVKCLKPRRILNPYTCESLIVECGSCPSCLQRKASLSAMKCKLESLSHKYCMFITLTYNNISLPRMMVKCANMQEDDCGEIYDDGSHPVLVDITSRLKTQGTVLGTCSNWYHVNYNLPSKVNLPKGILPHLSKYDLQLFFKRLRRNLEKYYERKFNTKAPQIRYYACGEYGPVHFRPHYHVMLWFSEDEIYKVIRQILHKSWSFGRIDCQKSLGQCSDYVAKYLNGSVPLPSVFKVLGTRPFSIHSTHLGEKVLEIPCEEIYSLPTAEVIRRSVPGLSVDSDVVLWRSLKNWYFPKCKGFASVSKQERLFAYTTYAAAREWTTKNRVSDQARLILEYCYGVVYHDPKYLRRDTKLIEYFIKSVGIDMYNMDEWESHLRCIYMELRTSKHFIEYVCKSDPNLYSVMVDKIDKFWNDCDSLNLHNQLSSQEEFSLSDWYQSDYTEFMYANRGFDLERFQQIEPYKRFRESRLKNAENSVKHKRLNDLNKIFVDN